MATQVFIEEKVTEVVLEESSGKKVQVVVESVNPSIIQIENLQGPVGPANTLTIGNVTTIAAGGNADASIGGFSPNQVLDLTLPRGDNSGIKYVFSTATTDEDPGNGFIRFNNATIGSVTFIYVDNLDYIGVNQSNWYTTFDDSTSTVIKGQIIVSNYTGVNSIFNVTGSVIDGTGYYKIPVSYVSGNTHSNNAEVFVSFYRVGDVGSLTQAQADSFYVNVDGDTMTGVLSMAADIDMDGNTVINIASPVNAGDAISLSYGFATYLHRAEPFLKIPTIQLTDITLSDSNLSLALFEIGTSATVTVSSGSYWTIV